MNLKPTLLKTTIAITLGIIIFICLSNIIVRDSSKGFSPAFDFSGIIALVAVIIIYVLWSSNEKSIYKKEITKKSKVKK
jgi:hypothetical protein